MRKLRINMLWVCLCIFVAKHPTLLHAQQGSATAMIEFSIKQGPLVEALKAFSEVSGVKLDYDSQALQGIETLGVEGSYTAQSGLERLLRHLPIDIKFISSNRFSLQTHKGLSISDVPTLQAVEVIGRASVQPFSEYSFATNKSAKHILDIPQSVSAATKEVIRDHNLLRLNEVSPYLSGVNEFSSYDDVTIRGFRNYDDRRVNGMRAYNSFWSQPLIAHLERVEVVKGPASVMFGDASPGGVINMVTKKPLQKSLHEVTATVGSYKKQYAAIDSTGPIDEDQKFLYRLNLGIEDSESFRNQYFNKAQIVAPSLSFLPTEKTRINLDFVFTDNKSVLDRGQPNIQGAQSLGEIPIKLMVTQPGDKLDTTTSSTHLTLEQKLGRTLSMVVSHMHYKYREELLEHAILDYITPSVISLDSSDRRSNANVYSNSAFLLFELDSGFGNHEVVFGVDTSHKKDRSKNWYAENVGEFDLLNPNYSNRDTSAYAYEFEAWGGELKTRGLYVQDQIRWDRWQMIFGLRQENFSSSPLGQKKQSGSALLPRLGFVYQTSEGSSLYASWLNGFEPPESWSNSEQYGGPFDPMDSEQIEVGFKHMGFDDKLLMTAAIYQIEKNNVVVWASDETNSDLYRQRGQERARGIELEVNGQVSERFKLMANYAYNDTRVTKEEKVDLVGRLKENAPLHAAGIWGKYSAGAGLSLGLGINHVGQRETFEKSLKLPEYTLYSAAIYHAMNDLSLAIHANNLSNKTHWSGGYDYGRVYPGSPQTFNLSINYKI